MMGLTIPEKFQLPERSQIGGLLDCAEGLLHWQPYFPEYTLHDAYHVQSVLDWAAELVGGKELSKDMTEALVSAIVIHDLGMSISKDGLQQLVFGSNPLSKFDWAAKWNAFYAEAKRWDTRKLIDIFGKNHPVERDIKEVPDADNKCQRFLFGEFIRRNHHLLAYEIAMGRYPDVSGNVDLLGFLGGNAKMRTRIGLIALGHGENLRNMGAYIEGSGASFGNEPLYFLMGILRIADLLDMGCRRAPGIHTDTTKLDSPVSVREWAWNQAIPEPPRLDHGRMTIEIDAFPADSQVFLGVQSNLHYLQQELDQCEAIVSKQHATYRGHLAFHVESNIFEPDTMNLDYIPKRAVLDAHPDLAKHMVGPLYGDDPAFGIRELLQNAIDACNERRDILAKSGDTGYIGKITVAIDSVHKTLTVTDDGIGMTGDVIRNYYLIAGASYRDSAAWRDKHTDDDGVPTIARSGRFGIGALAAFLLGDTVTVTTRHMDGESGLRFAYTLEPHQLEIKRVKGNDIQIGTTVVIAMADAVCKQVPGSKTEDMAPDQEQMIPLRESWFDWYKLTEPEVVYLVDGKRVNRERDTIPNGPVDKDGWYYYRPRTEAMPYDGVWWTDRVIYPIKISPFGFATHFYCNGMDSGSGRNEMRAGYDFVPPTISVMDKHGQLGLDIKRTSVSGFQMEPGLIREIYKSILTKALCEQHLLSKTNPDEEPQYSYHKQGFTLMCRSAIRHTKKDALLYVYDNDNWSENATIREGIPAIMDNMAGNDLLLLKGIGAFSWYSGIHIHDEVDMFYDTGDTPYNLGPCCGAVWMNVPDPDVIVSKWLRVEHGYILLFDHFLKPNTHPETQGRVIQQMNNDLYTSFPASYVHDIPKEARIAKAIDSNQYSSFVMEYMPKPRDGFDEDPEQNIMLALLREYLVPDESYTGACPYGLIPYDIEERFRMYPKAFHELRRYMPAEFIERFERFI